MKVLDGVSSRNSSADFLQCSKRLEVWLSGFFKGKCFDICTFETNFYEYTFFNEMNKFTLTKYIGTYNLYLAKIARMYSCMLCNVMKMSLTFFELFYTSQRTYEFWRVLETRYLSAEPRGSLFQYKIDPTFFHFILKKSVLRFSFFTNLTLQHLLLIWIYVSSLLSKIL